MTSSLKRWLERTPIILCLLLCIASATFAVACLNFSFSNDWVWTLDARIDVLFAHPCLEWLSTVLGGIALMIVFERAIVLHIGYRRYRPDMRDLLIYAIAITTFSFTYYLWLNTVHNQAVILK